MATIAELFTGEGGVENAREDYYNYRIACDEAGKKPLPYPDWLKAGKPKT